MEGEGDPAAQKLPRLKVHVCKRGCPFSSNLGPVLLCSSSTTSSSFAPSHQSQHDAHVRLTPFLYNEAADVSFLVRVMVMGSEDEEDEADDEGGSLRRYCQCLAVQGEDATLLLPLALLVASTTSSPSSSSSTLTTDMREGRRRRVEEVVEQLASLASFDAHITPLPGASAAR